MNGIELKEWIKSAEFIESDEQYMDEVGNLEGKRIYRKDGKLWSIEYCNNSPCTVWLKTGGWSKDTYEPVEVQEIVHVIQTSEYCPKNTDQTENLDQVNKDKIAQEEKQALEKFNQYQYHYKLRQDPNTPVKIGTAIALIRTHGNMVLASGFCEKQEGKDIPPTSFFLREEHQNIEIALGRLFAELERIR